VGLALSLGAMLAIIGLDLVARMLPIGVRATIVKARKERASFPRVGG
jgi:hypothetical protein